MISGNSSAPYVEVGAFYDVFAASRLYQRRRSLAISVSSDSLNKELKRLDASAVFAKMWLALGPLKWEGAEAAPTRLPGAFPAEIPGKKDSKYDGTDGKVGWLPRLVEPGTYALTLRRPSSAEHALYIAVTFVQVHGNAEHKAALKLAGTAATATPPAQVWLNRELLEHEPGPAPWPVTLRPGTNEIVIRFAGRKDGPGQITLGMSLTEPDGKRSTAFTYVDLYKYIGAQRVAPRSGQ